MRKDTTVLGSFIFFIAASSLGVGYGQNITNVVDYGATGDGLTDDSQAFLKAWENLCGATAAEITPILQIPENKTFLLQPVTFVGPCNLTTVHIQILGNIVSPNTSDAWNECADNCWICFSNVENLTVDGSGQIDGRGASWWHTQEANNSCNEPKGMHFHGCKNLQLSGLTHLNSPKAHIAINNCTDVSISNLHIIAPEDSPNTDGIDFSDSSQINIFNSSIGTGDDCVAINGASSFINITNVTCGPGHGISVGSLGQNGTYQTVEEVHVRNCTFNGTLNGARIKTWQGGSGYARKIYFDQITVIASQNPIIIDQHYLTEGAITANNTSAVEVSNVTYSNFQGTSASEIAITLNCSSVIGCTNIIMDQINITSLDPGKEVLASCSNAHGKITSTSLNLSCLSS